MNIIELTSILKTKKLSLRDATTDEERQMIFDKILKIIIRPKGQSDRTAFRNLSDWITEQINSGRYYPDEIYKIVLDFALEASGPQSKNPAAVFMSILKKELNYLKG